MLTVSPEHSWTFLPPTRNVPVSRQKVAADFKIGMTSLKRPLRTHRAGERMPGTMSEGSGWGTTTPPPAAK